MIELHRIPMPDLDESAENERALESARIEDMENIKPNHDNKDAKPANRVTSTSMATDHELPMPTTKGNSPNRSVPVNKAAVQSTPSRTSPIPSTKASLTNPLEAVRQRIVSLEAGSPITKSISKRDPLAINRTKRTKIRHKPYVCPGIDLCKSLLCPHEADNVRHAQERL
jgi:hypothetical protein